MFSVVFVLLNLFSMSLASPADSVIVEFGEYHDTEFKASHPLLVREFVHESSDGQTRSWVQVSLGLIDFYFDPNTGEATQSPWNRGTSRAYSGSYIPSTELKLINSYEKGDFRMYHWKLGGTWSVYNSDYLLVLNTKTGRLVRLNVVSRRARFGLPSGWHSGPLRASPDIFLFNQLELQRKSTIGQPSVPVSCRGLFIKN